MTTLKTESWIVAALLIAAPFWTSGCGGRGDKASARRTVASDVALPATLFTGVDGTPIGIAEARRTVADGERVVLRGMIGGRTAPFVENRAIMLLVDESLPLCHGCCDTPWDMCCERPEAVLENSATVQVVDADGQPLRLSLRGRGGLEPLASVVVSGTVRREGNAVFLVAADRLAVTARDAAAAPQP